MPTLLELPVYMAKELTAPVLRLLIYGGIETLAIVITSPAMISYG